MARVIGFDLEQIILQHDFISPNCTLVANGVEERFFFSVRPLTKAQGKVMLKNETNLPYHEREIQQCYSLKSSLI